MREGIEAYQRIEGGEPEQPPALLRQSADIYNDVGPKLLEESRLFRMF